MISILVAETIRYLCAGLPDDTVVAMAVHQNLGVEVKSERDWELLFKAVETLGGIESGKSLLRNVKDKEAYAFITVKGKLLC